MNEPILTVCGQSERKTATKQLNRLLRRQQELSEEMSETKDDELASLEKEIYNTRVDLNYAIYSPLTEKYISLYPNEKRGVSEEPAESTLIRNSSGEKPPLWYAVERSMKDGTLDLLRDGKLNIGLSGEKKGGDDGYRTNNTVDLPVLSKRQSNNTGPSSTKKNGAVTKGQSKPGANQDRVKDSVQADSEDESDGGFFE